MYISLNVRNGIDNFEPQSKNNKFPLVNNNFFAV